MLPWIVRVFRVFLRRCTAAAIALISKDIVSEMFARLAQQGEPLSQSLSPEPASSASSVRDVPVGVHGAAPTG